jgi:hypothetical protein
MNGIRRYKTLFPLNEIYHTVFKKSYQNGLKLKLGHNRMNCEDKMDIRNQFINVITPIKRKRGTLIKIVGGVALVIAILPNGLGVVLFPVAFACLGITIKDLVRFKKINKYKYKNGIFKKQLNNKLLLIRSK